MKSFFPLLPTIQIHKNTQGQHITLELIRNSWISCHHFLCTFLYSKKLHNRLSVPVLIFSLSLSILGSPLSLQAQTTPVTKTVQGQKKQASGIGSEILSSSNTQAPDAASRSLGSNNTQAPTVTTESFSSNNIQAPTVTTESLSSNNTQAPTAATESLSENNTQAPTAATESLSENNTQAPDSSSDDSAKTPESLSAETEDNGSGLSITATAAVLIDNHSGRILYEKEKDKELIPASITKIMTLLLIFEGLEQGRYQLTDEVTVSERASQMGGSQVYLEPGEVQTVETMIKCISIASANDAAVAMAEFVAGSETAFIDQMNQKAAELGMEHTHFMNCNGLDDSIESGHYSSAYDVALMSRALVMNHPSITNYSTVWMDTIIHKTKKGESEFGLTNTNKLIRTYQGITGLKTGSTSKAKYCLSATANRDGIDLTAVIMAAPNHKVRFTEAASLLDYGFANCTAFSESTDEIPLSAQNIARGTKSQITPRVEKNFSYVMCGEERNQTPKREITYRPNLAAPIKEGEPIGNVTYTLNNQKIGSIPIVAAETVQTAKYIHILKQLLDRICCNKKSKK